MKLLLIAPPRFFWPFMNEDDNWLLPQSLACLAAYLREGGVQVKVLDCMPLKMGWSQLEKHVRDEKPDVVGAGENHALYASEVSKLFRMVKGISRNILTIAGGSHFTNLIASTMDNQDIDYLVRGEGEVTLLELVRELLESHPDPSKIQGIAYRKNGKCELTEPRTLISDLDSLPYPAYDLMPMNMYGKAKYLFSPGGMTIHHSRGCVSECKFCGWWTQMADVRMEDGRLRYKPRWRTKSARRTVEEIRILRGFGKKTLVFVDESWNLNGKWNEEFAGEVLESGIQDLNWFAFMRADCIVRDEKAGIMARLVRSGLRHVCIGVERVQDSELMEFDKPFYTVALMEEAFRILKKYPEIFIQATFIVGTKNETTESMFEQVDFARKLGVDYPGFHPITPIPGTKLWEEANEKGLIEVNDFEKFDWLTPVMPSKYLTRDEIAYLLYRINSKYVSILWLIKGLLSRNRYKRHMYIWWMIVTFRVIINTFKTSFLKFGPATFTTLRKPAWYDT